MIIKSVNCIHVEISGFPGETKKGGCNNEYQPWEMEGSICEIEWKDEEKDHGLIIYKDVDTSAGQSGSMICLINPVYPNLICSTLIHPKFIS